MNCQRVRVNPKLDFMLGRSGRYGGSDIVAWHWRKNAGQRKDKSMKILLALIAMVSNGVGVANAATHQTKSRQQQGDTFNWLEGGGG